MLADDVKFWLPAGKRCPEGLPIGNTIWENQAWIRINLRLGNTTDMADAQESTPIDQANSEELNEIIVELELYRERLVNDTLAMAQKAKVVKTQAMASLEPQLAQIDAQIQALRQRQAALTAGN